jgi:S-DNA-T family DNA segregation ATPase FtsK/SpoIIIE
VFLALAVLPQPVASVTGRLGLTLGEALRAWLGVGVATVPMIALYWAVALFGHFDRALAKRVTILLAGLAVAVPFAAGTGYQLAGVDLAAAMDQHRAAWVGQVGAALAYELRGPLGLGGETILALAVFSALTIVTVGWNPLGRLRKQVPGAGDEVRGEEDVENQAPPLDEIIAASVAPTRMPRERRKRARKAEPEGEPQLMLLPPSKAAGRSPHEELPPLELLDEAAEEAGSFEAELDRLQQLLVDTLRQFKVDVRPGGRTTGPVVTQYELIPAAGVKVHRIAALGDDLALAIKAPAIRILAPIPGKGAVGIEVPNPTRRAVGLRGQLESPQYQRSTFELPIALGEDLEGRAIVADLSKMPHLLIAGATGSGKSVCINTIITSLVFHHTTDRIRMLMIDPKMVELSIYKELPHLRHPVVTDNKDAAKVFKWAVWEMQDRYRLLHANGARNVADFNHKVEAGQAMKKPDGEPWTEGVLPYIVLFVDELADLMMTVQAEVETPLAILAQKARAIGIHVVLATQRPSVNVVTGLIKANFPSRIAFRVASKVDSRTILDQNGAEALLGYGDMLFLPPGTNDPMRLQGAFISTEETERLMAWFAEQRERRLAALREQGETPAEANIIEAVNARAAEEEGGGPAEGGGEGEERDKLFRQAAELCIQAQGGSTSLLQRRLKIGYGRAARLIDQLELAGVLGPSDGPRGRDVLMGFEDLERIIGD